MYPAEFSLPRLACATPWLVRMMILGEMGILLRSTHFAHGASRTYDTSPTPPPDRAQMLVGLRPRVRKVLLVKPIMLEPRPQCSSEPWKMLLFKTIMVELRPQMRKILLVKTIMLERRPQMRQVLLVKTIMLEPRPQCSSEPRMWKMVLFKTIMEELRPQMRKLLLFKTIVLEPRPRIKVEGSRPRMIVVSSSLFLNTLGMSSIEVCKLGIQIHAATWHPFCLRCECTVHDYMADAMRGPRRSTKIECRFR